MPLANLRVAEPCHADWAAMSGDQRTRHCAACNLHVTDLSQLTHTEAESLLATRTLASRTCVRYTIDAAGHIVTRTTQHQRLVDLLHSLSRSAP